MRGVKSNRHRSGTQILVRPETESSVVNSTYIDLEMLAFVYRLFFSYELEVFQKFPSVWERVSTASLFSSMVACNFNSCVNK